MRVIGIDPGKTGAMAFLDGYEPYFVVPLPVIVGAARTQYDLPFLAERFREAEASLTNGPIHVFIERQQPIPKQGALAGFAVGEAQGMLQAFCHAFRLPYTLVSPRRWQAVMLDGVAGDDTKQRSILAAQRLFPDVNLKRTDKSRKNDHGFADALLIAAYGVRQLGGGVGTRVGHGPYHPGRDGGVQ